MFDVHAYFAQRRNINVNPFLKWPVWILTEFNSLADMATDDVGSNVVSKVWTVEALPECHVSFSYSHVTTHH